MPEDGTASPDQIVILEDGSFCPANLYKVRSQRSDATVDPQAGRSQTDRRSESGRDRGRVLYSRSLRRLAGVAQVSSPDPLLPLLHNRYSHSHKVSIVAREIAEDLVRRANPGKAHEAGSPDGILFRSICVLGGIDVAACEVAGLAHDLGHPPFGHAGEKQLNAELTRLSSGEDPFEGNAQTFRIVTWQESHHSNYGQRQGLDLTNVTLAAIAKYPWHYSDRQDSQKYSAYDEDCDILTRARSCLPGFIQATGAQSIEAAVMDIADDVTYATHDLEDAMLLGRLDFAEVIGQLEDAQRVLIVNEQLDSLNPFVTLSEKLSRYDDQYRKDAYVSQMAALAGTLRTRFVRVRPEDLPSRISSFVSAMVKQLLSGITVESNVKMLSRTHPPVQMRVEDWHMAQILKTITKHHVVQTEQMGAIQRAQQKAVQHLVSELFSWIEEAPAVDLPLPMRMALISDVARTGEEKVGRIGNDGRIEVLSASGKLRVIREYICGLTDAEALVRVGWLRGHAVPAFLGR